ncbi:hypothetical protein CDL15_Pgr012251 [Punica granatum]|uniref:Uncharacterized protein n=1 Tax=Punica granatum TaxID=22663 RepID=A0A218WSU8_PUNGR|nr:hypothetical protein CDL15_Pgr012251 [Punica granatum]
MEGTRPCGDLSKGLGLTEDQRKGLGPVGDLMKGLGPTEDQWKGLGPVGDLTKGLGLTEDQWKGLGPVTVVVKRWCCRCVGRMLPRECLFVGGRCCCWGGCALLIASFAVEQLCFCWRCPCRAMRDFTLRDAVC